MEPKCSMCVHFEKPWNEEPCKSCIEHEADNSTERINFVPRDSMTQTRKQDMNDPVNQPSHYMLKPGLEVRDVLECLVQKIWEAIQKDDYPQPYATELLFISDYVQMMQYLMRFMDKNGKQDLEKARWYLDKMIEAYGDS